MANAEHEGQAGVTQQMLDAGFEVYYQFEDGADDPARLLCDVFRAMLSAQQVPSDAASELPKQSWVDDIPPEIREKMGDCTAMELRALIARTFVELLSRAGLTKAELARRMGITSRAVARWGNEPPVYAVAYLELLVEFNRVRP